MSLPSTSSGRSRRPVVDGVALALCAAVTAVAAVLGTVVHQVVAGPSRLPLGWLLAVLLTASLAAFLRACDVSLAGRAGAILGWLVVTLYAAGGKQGQDVLIPGNARGYGWLLGGFLVLVLVLVMPGRRRPVARG